MTFPRYHRAEIAADAIVHALGVGFALNGGPILIGLEHSVQIARIGATATEVLNMAALAAYGLETI